MNRHEALTAAEYTAGTAATGIIGAAAGAVAANTNIANAIHPSTVTFAEGITAQVAAHPDKTEIVYGPTVTLPHLVANTPIGHIGAHIDLHANVALNSQGLAEFVGLAHNLTAVDHTIQNTVIERITVGGGIGAAVGAAMGALAVKKLREQGLIERIKNIPDSFRRKPLRNSIMVGASALALAGCSVTENNLDTAPAASGPKAAPLASIYPPIAKIPELRGSTISGTGGQIAKLLFHLGKLYVAAVDKNWEQASDNFVSAYNLEEAKAIHKFQMNKNIVGILDLSDPHCNYSANTEYFPTVIKTLKPNIINLTGDVFTDSDTMPYESGCATTFEDAVNEADRANGVKNTPIVYVAGNHDPLDKTIPGMINLNPDDNYTAKVDTITFVGIGDSVRTTTNTYPATIDAQDKLLAEDGSKLAQVACAITKKTGEAPHVDVHQREAAFETMEDGCASMVDVGHTHEELPIQRFVSPNGTEGIYHMAGSATGANVGITIEETEQLPATGTMEYFNKKTRRYVGFITFMLVNMKSAKNVVTFEPQNLNANGLYNDTEALTFLKEYSKTYKPNNVNTNSLATKDSKPDQASVR